MLDVSLSFGSDKFLPAIVGRKKTSFLSAVTISICFSDTYRRVVLTRIDTVVRGAGTGETVSPVNSTSPTPTHVKLSNGTEKL